MKTMRNEYRDLKKENDLIFSTLAEYDRDTITEIISVADNTRGIGYEIELIRKDLIAMAAQAEARRDYLPSVIGDVDVFKRNLLASMPKPKFADYMADSLVWLCTFALASAATYTVIGRPWDCHYDSVWLVLCIAIMRPRAWLLQRIVPAEWAASTEKGVRYGAITAAMIGSYVDLYRVKLGAAKRKNYSAVHKDFGYKGSDYRLKRSAETAAHYTLPQLEACLQVLLELDQSLKSQPVAAQTLLETALCRLALAGSGR